MASFSKAIDKTLRWEGGFTIDTGGKTKYGISQNAYPNLNIADLTLDQAKAIYKKDYWDKVKGDLIGNDSAAAALFDFAVNAGIGRATIETKRALNGLGYKFDLTANSSLPSEVLAAINAKGDVFANALQVARLDFYSRLAKENPDKYGKYLIGWTKRAKDFFSVKNPITGLVVMLAAVLGFVVYKKARG